MSMSKADWRREVRRRRQALTPEERFERSRRIADRVLALPEIARAQTIMAYLARAEEVATADLLGELAARGKRLAVPVTRPAEERIIPILLPADESELVRGAMGILEPAPENSRPVAAGEIDLVLVPGVAFDVSGSRIGYGKGYYDRFFQAQPMTAGRIGLAFEVQIIPAFQREAYDWPVEQIVTEDRIIDCRREADGQA